MGRGRNSKRSKGGGGGGGGGSSGSKGARAGSSVGLLDRNLAPRIEEYALNHDISDVDDVVDYLRRNYKEYQRRQTAALRQMVVRALQVVQQRGVAKPELQIQALESRHLAAQQQQPAAAAAGSGAAAAADGSSSEDEGESSSSDEGEDDDADSDNDGDLDPQAAAGMAAAGGGTAPPHNGLNNSLLSMYSNAAAAAGSQEGPQAAAGGGGGGDGAEAQPADSAAQQQQQGGASSSGSGDDGGDGSSSDGGSSSEVDPDAPPAFAPPHVVAAAAARALAAEKAERAAKAAARGQQGAQAAPPGSHQQQQQAAAANSTPAGAAGTVGQQAAATPTASAAARQQQSQQQQQQQPSQAEARQPAAAAAGAGVQQQQQQAGGAGGESTAKSKRSRSAEEAGLGRDSRAVSKKLRRSSTAAGGGGGGAAAAATAGGGGGGAGGSRKGGSAVTAPRALRYADLGGVEEVLADIRELIEYPLKHPEVYRWLGVEPPRGVLLHGPPGCGKTALAHAIATECGVPFLRVSAPEVVSGMSGESEARLRQLFQEAVDVAPSIIFIDEIDAIAPKRETAQREMERRIVAQMLTCMDDLAAPPPPVVVAAAAADGAAGGGGAAAAAAGNAEEQQQQQQQQQFQALRQGHVVVIGATNRPDALDPALRRAGRFDREISLGIPTEAARQQILQVLTRPLRLQGGFDFVSIARKTPGFVGADLAALTKEAAAVAVSRIFREIDAAAAGANPNSSSAAAAQSGQQQQQQGQQQPLLQLPAAPAPLDGVVAGAGEADAAGAALDPSSSSQQQQQPAAAVDTSQQQQHQPSLPQPQQPSQHSLPAAAAAVVDAGGARMGAGPLTVSELSGLAISMSDFEAALPKVQPSVRREGFTTKPDATWEDVGSLEEVREELSFSISQPIAHPEAFAAMGLSSASGVLLYGPPGCGKTLVAKAVAAESGANFISIKGPELLNKYVGESERAVRQLFARARAAHPCVLFFDEMDALAPRRGSDNNAPAERLVNQLLTEMDGIDGRVGVYVVAATNRPDMIDPALLRPGRLDKVLFVPLPPPDGRASILAAAGRRTPMAAGVMQQAQELVRSERCEGFSGADVAALVKEAAVLALKESMAALMAAASARQQAAPALDSAAAAAAGASGAAEAAGVVEAAAGAARPLVYLRHFEAALLSVSPSVNKKDRRAYELMRVRLRGARAHMPVTPATGSEGGGAGNGAAGNGAAGGEGSGMVDGCGGGDDMEGVDDAPAEPADPMKDD